MRAIDTNVVVRLIARDDARAEAIARGVLDGGVLLLPTVLLETEWVLRSVYKMRRPEIARALRILLGHERVLVANAAAVANALLAYETGADLADALHLELAFEAGAESFATFDKGVGSSTLAVDVLDVAAT